ncbi:bifunctional [glutamate--ammonia ligase]-adenylyl-L-tyrosine phosphorylase/[glutamate--ammonia-ligase] adenylyltransferase [Mesosutterella sp. OilRF-GAM-744-9]|uniref:Bifunctional glutamine synthetase adenylyltransferase/adenylyl-removing enzyme n=1 Tax=Mesosutterella porci TaxID=2915351 RepID=A0ABS9MNX4_9BURK|nr:bifunctional [glutamate--ammonia ligase]-adenylyl-L-tyrosine phosphorylase/[glutamate--ammonia-ligase] adenylyltransferase [Mesosutterella sp. oilRF-744-WT-GAM-9]MCG5030328.1 bifunctional [glutamate--ammonia ligase]-adenylyl-L-tyrosine phosphorylase/[glutamate--ammonia-ligase] adenylyltransferase [Mesosutterella sp. oilRF-744-WT-GAM-9]
MENSQFKSILSYSPFLRRSLAAVCGSEEESAQIEAMKSLAAAAPDMEAIRASLSGVRDEEELALRMRELRRELIMRLLVRNALRIGGYPEVVSSMTRFAEITVQAAVKSVVTSLAERFGVPCSENTGQPQDLLVVGMGKLGGAELNVSSDIDLIFLYDEDGETQESGGFKPRRSISNREFFERASRRIIPLLSDIRGCGFVFRVDMRLRPDGDSGPMACSSGMLEEYLYTEGREWERFAWIKARIVSSPVFSSEQQFRGQCSSVSSLVRPFVYRKYVDFSAVSSLARLHDMIRAESRRRELQHRGRGVDIKIGAGGIREIEFIAQTYQLIRGGRNPQLRSRSTLQTLTYLSERGILTQEKSERLKRSYVFLRCLEHAIQYVDDQQTQLWPSDPQARARVAGLMGEDPGRLDATLSEIRGFVSETFDSIFHARDGEDGAAPSGWPEGWLSGAPGVEKDLAAKIASLGYDHAPELAERVLLMMRSKTLGRSNGALERMGSVVETVFEHCAGWAGQDSSTVGSGEELDRCLRLLEVIAGRPTYVALLYQYPDMLRRVGRVLASSRWAADYLTEHPIILDELLDQRVEEFSNDTPVDWSRWRQGLERDLAAFGDDQERQLNLLRDAHHGAVFRLLMADLDRRLSTERLADQLSALADTVIGLVMDLAWKSLSRRFEGEPRFAVIAYGKLGGKELGYASDLDLIYLYDDDRPDAELVYSRLVRRMMNWLSMQTSSGRLFEVDLRLRPNGDDGLLVSPFDLWKAYERNEDGKGAWTWELQALTRARFCAGDRSIGARFEKERREILRMKRNHTKLAREILEMRERMLEGHRNPTPLFDIKHDRGGMVDIEFAVQYLVLACSCDKPELLDNLGNIRLLAIAGEQGLIPGEIASEAAAAYRRYREIQREVRLARGDGPVRVEPGQLGPEREAVLRLWSTVFGVAGPSPAK